MDDQNNRPEIPEELLAQLSDLDPGLDLNRLPGVVHAMVYLSPPDMRRRAQELFAKYPGTGWLEREPEEMFGFFVGPPDNRHRICGFHKVALLGDDTDT